MPLSTIHSFLIKPGKGVESPPDIAAARVAKADPLFKMLEPIYNAALTECRIDVIFAPTDDAQQNDCLDELVAYAGSPKVALGRAIALRLQQVTTNRSGLGLLFLMSGDESGERRLVISRFPADSGVLAEESASGLSVAFLERVFMKNAKAYKSAVYQSSAPSVGYWTGKAIDKQITGGSKELSDYWIKDFLLSSLQTTGPAGTKRLAVAMRTAIRTSEMAVRQELVAAAALMAGQDGKKVTGDSLASSLGLSAGAKEAITGRMPSPDLMGETFEFVHDEFRKHVQYQLVELDNGAILMADSEHFNEVFEQDAVSDQAEIVRFSTEGRVEDVRLKSSR